MGYKATKYDLKLIFGFTDEEITANRQLKLTADQAKEIRQKILNNTIIPYHGVAASLGLFRHHLYL